MRPQAGLDIILDVSPLDIYIKIITANSPLRLKESEELMHDQDGHGTILRAIIGSNLIQSTEYLLPRMIISKTFGIIIPFRGEWATYCVMKDYVISLSTDASKTETDTSDIFSDDLNFSVYVRLPNICKVFQAANEIDDWALDLRRTQTLLAFDRCLIRLLVGDLTDVRTYGLLRSDL